MALRRKLSWNSALRDLKDDRAARADVREELLKTPGPAGSLGMAAWRGKSGRRYAGIRYTVNAASAAPEGPAVVVAVKRRDVGHPTLIGARRLESGMDFEAMRARIRRTGADEIFIHRLSETEAERSAVVRDLYADRAA